MSSEPLQTEDTLADFIEEVWAARVFVLAGILVGVIAAFITIALAVPHNRGQMTLAPASPMNMAASRSASQSGSVAPAESVTNDVSFTRFEASYKGAGVAGLLLRDPEITAGLAKDKAFKFSKAEGNWTPEKLAEYIRQRVDVDPVGETRLRTYSYLHPDKEFAVMFLRRLHNITDGLIRHGLRKDVNERITYLNKSLSETMNPEHRRAMTDLLMEQERLKMLVSIDQPYAASVVVPAAGSVKARWPDPVLMYSSFMLVGAFLGFVVFGLRGFNEENVLAGLPIKNVKQQDWFFPESGNSNEKPEKKAKPLTGKKEKKKPVGNKSKKAAPPEAAE